MPISLDITHKAPLNVLEQSKDLSTVERTALRPFFELSFEELHETLLEIGIPLKQTKMRAEQLWKWVYVKGVTDFNEMTNVSKDLRSQFQNIFSLKRPEIVEEQISTDGTRKWLLRLSSEHPAIAGPEIETVYIPEKDRGTLCISSQVGCTLTCTFCHTGTQRLVRNLTAGEIIQQVLLARDRIGDWPKENKEQIKLKDQHLLPEGERMITNVVLMGMGEPLYNYDNVKKAMAVVSDGHGIALSKRRITLSTSGVVPLIHNTGAEMGVNLAISLHAVRNDLRDILVPINKKYPLEELMEACRTYPNLSNARRITWEYVMLKGVNDSLAEARDLVKLLKGIPSKINLIPFNPWPGTEYECSDWEKIEKFADIVNRAGYASPVRTPRGRDIFAACGQLKSASERMRKKDRDRLLESQ